MSHSTALTLPSQLGDWAPWLRELSHEVQCWLMSAVAQLDALLPPVGLPAAAPSGEFAGFDGIQSRGRVERLLMSEWLYAEELPDEFLRRASSGELWYLKPALEQPGPRRALVVLFDSGPAQLGACRLAHLALWVLLARRAQTHGWMWRWGCLQHPQELHDNQQASALHALMAKRSLQLLDAPLVQQWRDLLQPLQLAEVWIIGAATPIPQLASGAQHCIRIHEPLRFEQRILELRSPSAQVALELPEPRLAARLLRNPLGPDTPTRSLPLPAAAMDGQFARKQTAIFSGDGRRVAVRLRDDRSCVVQVPNSPRDPRSSLHNLILSTDDRTVAIGIGPGRKSYCQIKLGEARLRFVRAFGLPDPIVKELEVDFQVVALAPGVRHWCPLWQIGQQLLLLDQRRALHCFALDQRTQQPVHQLIARQVIGTQVERGGAALRYATAAGGTVQLGSWPEQAPMAQTEFVPGSVQRVLFGTHTLSGCLLELREQNWCTLDGQSRVRVPPGEIVLGCWANQLVSLSRSGSLLRLHDIASGKVNEMEPGTPLSAAVLSPQSGTVAGFGPEHDLLMYCLPRRTLVLRVHGAAP